MRHIASAAIAAAILTGPAQAQAGGERLVRPALPGFIIGHDARQNGSSMLEQVPAGESVQRWTRMVTTQRFAGLAARTDARTFLANLATSVARACPGAKISPIAVRGAEFQLRADCPRNPSTGQPETFFAKAMMGATDLHIAQVAFRRVPVGSDVQWANAYLAGVTLCRAGNKAGPCAGK